ncbi:MAG: putative sulfoacetate transporter SauU [Chlamydiae bacterium]|nr:putative sulfoacetate transporter SauU [Chlamydiota bacterium]
MTLRAWLIWFFASFFYLYELVLRISPGTMVDDLMGTLNITASGIGMLGAIYYLSYTPLQLPVGILMDCFGAKLWLTLACLLCGVGSFVFSLSNSFFWILGARFIIGIGSAFAWVGLIFLVSHWFKTTRRALMIGLASSIGMIGGIFGQGPLASIVQEIGYKETLWILGFFGIVLAVLMFIFIKDDPKQKFHHTKRENLKITKNAIRAIKTVCTNKQTWKVALYSTLILSSTTVFAELWGISFLQTKFNIDKTLAGFGTSIIYFGWLIGSPIVGFISDDIKKRRPPLIIGGLIATLCILVVIAVPNTPLWLNFALLFIFGAFSSVQLLTFSMAVELNPTYARGTAGALNNFVTMIGGLLLQPFVGWILTFLWKGGMQNNIPVYSFSDFRMALFILPLMCFLGFLLSFSIKETHCKQLKKKKHAFEFHQD